MRSWIYAAALSVTLTNCLAAQHLTAPLLSGSWQSTYHNPAMLHFLPDRVTVGLPGIANDLQLENLRYGDIVVREGGNRIVQFDIWSDQADEQNEVRNAFSIETLGLAVRAGDFVFSGYHRLRTVGQAEYHKRLIELVAMGNAPFIGQTVEIAPVGEIVSFQELGLSASYAIDERIAISGRIKYLVGVSAIQTGGGNSLQLTTGTENYALTLQQDLTLNTVRAVDYRMLDDFNFTYSPSRLRPGDFFTANNGLALDLGVAVNLDRLRLNASATDIGAAIEWKEEITNFHFNGTQSFTGLDIITDLLRDTVSLEEAVDSLVRTFEPGRTTEGFRSEIGATYYLGGEYDVTDQITAGALLVLGDGPGGLTPTIALTGRYTINDWLQAGINLNHRAGIRTNIGLHVYATPGRFRLFASSDKFFTLIGSGSPALAGIRLGASLSLGTPSGERSRPASSFRP